MKKKTNFERLNSISRSITYQLIERNKNLTRMVAVEEGLILKILSLHQFVDNNLDEFNLSFFSYLFW